MNALMWWDKKNIECHLCCIQVEVDDRLIAVFCSLYLIAL